MSDLPAALAWKYGPVADTAGGVVTAWRHPSLPQPTPTEIAQVLAEYDAAVPKLARIAAARSETIAVMASWVWAQQYGSSAEKAAAKAALDTIKARYPDVTIADLRTA